MLLCRKHFRICIQFFRQFFVRFGKNAVPRRAQRRRHRPGRAGEVLPCIQQAGISMPESALFCLFLLISSKASASSLCSRYRFAGIARFFGTGRPVSRRGRSRRSGGQKRRKCVPALYTGARTFWPQALTFVSVRGTMGGTPLPQISGKGGRARMAVQQNTDEIYHILEDEIWRSSPAKR